MKKLIALSLLLLPSLVLAADAGVTIDSFTVDGATINSTGTVTYEGLLTLLTVQIDGSNVIQRTQSQPVEDWSVSERVSGGFHTLTAILSRQDGGNERSTSREFRTAFGGGLSPCQVDGVCPNFGMFAPRVPNQNEVPKFRYVNPGEEGCPAFFTQRCLIK